MIDNVWTDRQSWRHFLVVISVERTEQFIKELELPVTKIDYKKTMCLARACLEADMIPSIERRLKTNESPNLLKFWALYRSKEGILPFPILQKYADCDAKQWDLIIFDIFEQYQEWIGKDKAVALRKWYLELFVHHLKTETNLHLLSSLSRLMRDKSNLNNLQTFLLSEQISLLSDFCNRMAEIFLQNLKRFRKLEKEAAKKGATIWECVLATYPSDSDVSKVKRFYWLTARIGKCVLLKTYKEEWHQLIEKLSNDPVVDLLKWTYKETNVQLKETISLGFEEFVKIFVPNLKIS